MIKKRILSMLVLLAAVATGAWAQETYKVSVKSGTEDANKWEIAPAEATTAGVTAGTTVTATYSGTKKVKSVKAKKKAGAKTLAEATLEDIGKIAGADGKIYATKAAAEAVATGNAVAMIAYVGTESDCPHGLAIALADESGWKNYGAAGTACSGKAAVTGGSWRLPSIKDWQYMFIGCGASGSYSDTPSPMSYSGLASKLTTAQGEYVATSLQQYFERHPEIEQRCTKNGQVHYLTTENPDKFREQAQLFLNEAIDVENITLG